MTKPENARHHGSALDKAVAVLEIVTRNRTPIGLPELTASTGLPRQTVHRLLTQLTANGLIARTQDKDRYAVGPRLSQLAIEALVSANTQLPVRSILQALVEDINETCNIGILDGLDFIYLERIESDWPLRVHLQAGSRVPAYCTSGGKALLAHLPSRTRRHLLETRPLAKHTPTTVTSPELLNRQFAACRKLGFALNNEEYTPGIVGLAVPVHGAGAQPVAALACHAPSARTSVDALKRHTARLQSAAAAISTIWSGNESGDKWGRSS